MLEFLIATAILGIASIGYWRGWSDAKQQERDFRMVDRLAELARPNRAAARDMDTVEGMKP